MSPCSARADRRHFLYEGVTAAAIFSLSLLLIYRLAILDFDPHHTGLMYKTALDMASGKVLFRDTYTQYGALTSSLQALSLLVLGKRVTSILFSTAFFYAASLTLFYAICRRFLPRSLSVTAVAITLFLAPYYTWTFHPWSSVYALFFLLLSALMTIKAATDGSLLFGGAAGFFATLTFWCRQPVGLVALLAILLPLFLFFAVYRRHDPAASRRFLLQCSAAAVGTLLAFFAFFIPIVANGALTDFRRQCLEGMVTFADSRSQAPGGVLGMALYNLFLSPLDGLDTLWIDYIWFLLPLSSLALFGLYTYRLLRKSDKNVEQDCHCLSLIVFSVFAVASWHQYYPVACYRHWYWGAFPSVLSAVLLARELVGLLLSHTRPERATDRKWNMGALVLCLCLLFGTNLGYRMGHGTAKLISTRERVKYEHEVYHHLDGVYLWEDVALYHSELFDAVAVLQEKFPEKNIINTTENAIYALFGENFCPLFNNCGDFFYAEYPALLADYIERERPIVIGKDAPDESYVRWMTPNGNPDDPFADYHRLPAHIYVPAELMERLGG